jgi:hypothetical protein
MATKKRAKAASSAPDDKAGANRDEARPGSATDAETTSNTQVDSDVERTDSKPRRASVDSDVEGSDGGAAPAVGNVEALDPATPRIDIEHDGAADAGDVERGPPK